MYRVRLNVIKDYSRSIAGQLPHWDGREYSLAQKKPADAEIRDFCKG